MELNLDVIETFNNFIRMKDVLKPSSASITRYQFFKDFLIDNRMITVKAFQLCTTRLAEKYEVHHSTVSKWLKKLVTLGILEVVNKKWLKNSFSKSYKIRKEYLDSINRLNGYAEEYSKNVKKKEFRSKKLDCFDPVTYSMKDAVKLASGWLGCPKQFVELIKEVIPDAVLKVPRENNIKERRYWDFFYAYNIVVGENDKKYKKIKKKEWAEAFKELESEEVPLTYWYGKEFRSRIRIKEALHEFKFILRHRIRRGFKNFREKQLLKAMEKVEAYSEDVASTNFVAVSALVDREDSWIRQRN